LAGLSVRLGLTRHLKLSPEGTQWRELKGLVDGLVQDGINHIVLMLHSTSLMPGFSPYCKTPEALENLYDRLEKTLQYAIEHHHFQGAALLDVATKLNTTFAPNHY
jgi:sugar phosphate isomerase/epimerase